jgi:hypothetical protein
MNKEHFYKRLKKIMDRRRELLWALHTGEPPEGGFKDIKGEGETDRMLRATIEIVPYGDENRKRSLYVIEIGNDGTGNIDTGNYDVILYECDIDGRYPCGTTRVKGYKRNDGALGLVHEALTKLHDDKRRPMKK